MIIEQVATPFTAVAEAFDTGLVGILGVTIKDADGNIVLARTTANITELYAGSGTYQYEGTTPSPQGQYTITWDDASGDVQGYASEYILAYVGDVPPILPVPPVSGQGPQFGPCQNWTTEEDIAACCSADVGTYDSLYEAANTVASQMLFELSGRLYSGICTKTVRPCRSDRWCGLQVLSRGYVVGWNDWGRWGWWGGDGRWSTACGCRPLDRVWLSGYPVSEIVQVLIDGVAVDPATYRLDEWRFLTRVRDPAEPDVQLFWPTCQNLDLPDTEVGTFAVTYEYGAVPPAVGQEAAKQLACEIYKACVGDDSCALPQGVTRIVRQGLTIERTVFAYDNVTKSWRTGLTLVDAFLNSFAARGTIRRPTIWTPDGDRYARPVGTDASS